MILEELEGTLATDIKRRRFSQKKRTSKIARIEDLLKMNQDVLVQVVKEPLGTKGPRVTTHIALPGRYVVLMPNDKTRGISQRIADKEERVRLRRILDKLSLPKDVGIIVRTVAEASQERKLAREIKYLMQLWTRINNASLKEKAPCLIHEEHDLVLRVLRDLFTEDIDKLLVDSKAEYRKIAHFLGFLSRDLRTKLELYQDKIPLFEKSSIEEEIGRIFEKKVSLRCGGYVVIEQTEGLVAIDVNTGRCTKKKNLEETAYIVNREAAQEIARQVRLRDMGGIIVIDFIDMEKREYRKKVFRALEEALRRDKAKINLLPLSSIGLIEMTRQRRRLSPESLSYERCPYCQGRGSVKSSTTITISALRKIRKFLEKNRKRQIQLSVHPKIAGYLLNKDKRESPLHTLEREFKTRIMVATNPDLHIEELKID